MDDVRRTTIYIIERKMSLDKPLLNKRAILVATLVCCGAACVSVVQYDRVENSVDAVQAACTSDTAPKKDGWGNDLIIIENDPRGVMVVSMGRDRSLDRPLKEYWDPSTCGMTRSLDADVVCVAGKLRRWPELSRGDLERMLPKDCDV